MCFQIGRYYAILYTIPLPESRIKGGISFNEKGCFNRAGRSTADELKSLSLKITSKTDSSDDAQDAESVSTSLVAKPEGEFSRRLTTTKSKTSSGEMETIEYFDGEFYFNNYDGTKWER